MHFPAQKIGKSLKIVVESPFLNEHVIDFAKSIPVHYNIKIEKKQKIDNLIEYINQISNRKDKRFLKKNYTNLFFDFKKNFS